LSDAIKETEAIVEERIAEQFNVIANDDDELRKLLWTIRRGHRLPFLMTKSLRIQMWCFLFHGKAIPIALLTQSNLHIEHNVNRNCAITQSANVEMENI